MIKNRKPNHRKTGSPREFRLSANVMEEEAWDDAGPNMKISKAFVVVLILHVVAVAGLAAFSFFEKKEAPEQAAQMDGATLPPPKTPSEIVSARPVVGEPAPVQTPAASETLTPGASALPETFNDYETIVVEQSASVGEVATRYGLTEEALIRYNPGQDPSAMIMAGTRLRLPKELVDQRKALAAQAAPPAPTPQPEAARPREAVPSPVEAAPRREAAPRVEEKPVVAAKPVSRSYTVKKGENLYRIAKRHGVSVEAISEANNISDPSKIAAGQTLVIPGR